MSELVERVAKAIDDELGDDHESLVIEMGQESISKKLRAEAMTRAARAAIDAMRSSTDLDVGHPVFLTVRDSRGTFTFEEWQKMPPEIPPPLKPWWKD